MARKQASRQRRAMARGKAWARRLDFALTSAAILWLLARFALFAWRRSA
jgi:hypothetical protein